MRFPFCRIRRSLRVKRLLRLILRYLQCKSRFRKEVRYTSKVMIVECVSNCKGGITLCSTKMSPGPHFASPFSAAVGAASRVTTNLTGVIPS